MLHGSWRACTQSHFDASTTNILDHWNELIEKQNDTMSIYFIRNPIRCACVAKFDLLRCVDNTHIDSKTNLSLCSARSPENWNFTIWNLLHFIIEYLNLLISFRWKFLFTWIWSKFHVCSSWLLCFPHCDGSHGSSVAKYSKWLFCVYSHLTCLIPYKSPFNL